MTDQQLIEWAATKVMGWHKEKIEAIYWSPLTNANHDLMVRDAFMAKQTKLTTPDGWGRWMQMSNKPARLYQPGDFTRMLHEVMEGK